jgi:hypothetical protein
MISNFFSPLSFVAVLDPGSEIRDPGSGINIPDPQHCISVLQILTVLSKIQRNFSRKVQYLLNVNGLLAFSQHIFFQLIGLPDPDT